MTSHHFSQSEALDRVVSLLVIASTSIFLILYITIIAKSWFFQDDFGFWFKYDQLNLQSLFTPSENFGRPISRDLYWFTLKKIFYDHATLYYAVNLSLIILNTLLLYTVGKWLELGKTLSSVWALSYFIMGPTIINLSWLSNSQHIIAHTFVFSTILWGLAVSRCTDPPFKLLLLGIMLSLIGLASNTLFSFVMPILLYQSFLMPSSILSNKKKYSFYIIIGIIVLVGLGWLAYMSKFSTGAYSTTFKFDTIKENLNFYANSLNIYIGLPLCIPLIWLGVKKNPRLTGLLLVGAITFLVPFLFLRYQRYENYAALSHTFYIGACLPGIYALSDKAFFIVYRRLIIALLIILLCSQNNKILVHALNHPKGASEKQLITQLASTDLASATIICFHPDKPTHNTTGVAEWNIPGFWWGLGFGQAFKLIPDLPNNSVLFLLYNDLKCSESNAKHFIVRESNGNLRLERNPSKSNS